MIATKRIYLTADRKSAVFEGDPTAAFLLVGVGGELKDSEAERLGLFKPVEPPAELPPPAQARKNRAITETVKR